MCQCGDDLRRDIRIEIHGIPVPKGRPRVAASGHVYTPAKTRHWERAAAWIAASEMQGRDIIRGPVRMRVTATMPVPRSWPEKRRRAALAGETYPTGRPDTDNISKAALDALNGIVMRDDAQVVEIIARKVYGAAPSVVIEISEIGGAS